MYPSPHLKILRQHQQPPLGPLLGRHGQRRRAKRRHNMHKYAVLPTILQKVCPQTMRIDFGTKQQSLRRGAHSTKQTREPAKRITEEETPARLGLVSHHYENDRYAY